MLSENIETGAPLTVLCMSFVATQVLDEAVVVNHSDDMFAPVGLLRVIKCHTEPKPPLSVPVSAASSLGENSAEEGEGAGSGRGAVDDQADSAAAAAVADSSKQVGVVGGDAPSGRSKEGQGAVAASLSSPLLRCLPHVHEGSGGLVYLSGIRTSRRAGEAKAAAATTAAEVAARQTADCLAAALAGLDGIGVSFRDVCFVHLYLRDMGHFSAVNEEYCKWVQRLGPAGVLR